MVISVLLCKFVVNNVVMGEVRDKVFKQGDKAVQAVSVQEFREK